MVIVSLRRVGQLALCLLAVATLSACNDEQVILQYEKFRAMPDRDVSGNVLPERCSFELAFRNNLDEVIEKIEPSWWMNGTKQRLITPSYGYRNNPIKIGETTKNRYSIIRMKCADFKNTELRIEQCATTTKTCTDAVVEHGRNE